MRRLCALLTSVVLLSLSLSGSVTAAPRPVAEAPAPESAAPPPTAAPGSEDDREAESEQDTPRRALIRFLTAGRAHDFDAASAAIRTDSSDVGEARRLARQLYLVMERKLPLDKEHIARLSDAPDGDTKDGLPTQDEIGRIELPFGDEPVRLQQTPHPRGEGRTWVFSPKTTRRVGYWYSQLDDHFFLELFPDTLLTVGPLGILAWQWVMLPLFMLGAAVLGVVLAPIARTSLRRLVQKHSLATSALEHQHGPLRLFIASIALLLLLPLLFLTATALHAVHGLVEVAITLALCWAVWRASEVFTVRAQLPAWLTGRPGLIGVMPLLRRLLGLLLLAIVLAAALSALGFSVTSLLAGLGLGGLAVAMAAKTTLENLFGGVTLSVDQPLRIGDSVSVDGVNGTVEQIGMRSTRIRTADRSLVTIPNGKLADMKIETIAARDRTRFFLSLNVVYGLRAAGLRELQKALLACVRGQPLIWPDRIRVHIVTLTDSALTIEIQAWFQTTEQDAFLDARQELILQLLEVVERFGATAALSSTARPAAPPAAPTPSAGR
ncbi:MAG: mechanosensitive ion channel family protein [Polyangia bacterium]